MNAPDENFDIPIRGVFWIVRMLGPAIAKAAAANTGNTYAWKEKKRKPHITPGAMHSRYSRLFTHTSPARPSKQTTGVKRIFSSQYRLNLPRFLR